MINQKCEGCSRQLPVRSPAVFCKQCRYKRGTAEIFARLAGFLARGYEMVINSTIDATCQGIKASGKAQPVKGALAVKLAEPKLIRGCYILTEGGR